MSTDSAILRVAGSRQGDGAAGLAGAPVTSRGQPQAVVGVALWVFIGVATTLFTLFIAAYIMRMANADAAAIAMPSQLWLSTALLVAGSVLLRHAGVSAQRGGDGMARAWRWLMAGGACAVAFLVVQGWAWQLLLARQVGPAGNPAGSFFYVLTALHGMHVAGGMIAWAVVALRAGRSGPAGGWRIALLARYWHFLLLAWLALFASFTWITPEVARIICGVP